MVPSRTPIESLRRPQLIVAAGVPSTDSRSASSARAYAATVAVDGLEVPDQSGQSLRALEREAILDARDDDVAQLVERDPVQSVPVVRRLVVVGRALGDMSSSTPIAALRLSTSRRRWSWPKISWAPTSPPPRRPVGRPPSCLASVTRSGRCVLAAAAVSHRGDLRLRQHPVVPDAVEVDSVAGRLLVFAEPLGRSGNGSWVERSDTHARSSIGSPGCASSQSTIAATRSPWNMKLPGPVSPCTSTGRPS